MIPFYVKKGKVHYVVLEKDPSGMYLVINPKTKNMIATGLDKLVKDYKFQGLVYLKDLAADYEEDEPKERLGFK